MILDLEQFVATERPYWLELEAMLETIDDDSTRRMSLDEARRLHYLYQRTAGGLARMETFSAEPATRQYLESLVSRAYGEMHEVRGRRVRFRPVYWLTRTVPRTFRRHWIAFAMSCTVTLIGAAFGAGAVNFDTDAKNVLLPFPHLLVDPSDRVDYEERDNASNPFEGMKAQGTSMYFVNNTRVSFTTMALGVTWGAGTTLILFTNGILLGAVIFDYIRAGEGIFLTGWLLPHGSVEIPSILIAGQAGLLLGSAIIGWRSRLTLRGRLRQITADLVTLAFTCACLMAWAGVIEAFFSQYHEPILPYWIKITFGGVQFICFVAFMTFAGRRPDQDVQI
jgi:uncharacterized membrane protein SpoIIM required for sporulation